MSPVALLDSNVVVAIVADAHEHHAPSLSLINTAEPLAFAVAAHSFAEAFSTLTRVGGAAPFGVPPGLAWAALESLRASTALLGLTAAETFDATRLYARTGGTGPRLYDRLIGEVAVIHGLPAIVTWNLAHMRGLFPDVRVETPLEFHRGASSG